MQVKKLPQTQKKNIKSLKQSKKSVAKKIVSIAKKSPKQPKKSNSTVARQSVTHINAITGGVTAAVGFQAAAVKAGIKVSKKTDLAIVYSDVPASAAGTFTKNIIRAACVERCESILPSNKVHAFVCNSGCANACTGKRGIRDNVVMASTVASALGVMHGSVMTASTGVIGKYLPMDNIVKATSKLVGSMSTTGAAGTNFAGAIMTTDLVKKEFAVCVKHGSSKFTIGGAVKGSGMIHPNMATMLCFITTDVAIDGRILRIFLKRAVDRTFNNLTVDGDMSTNDMVLIMANGASGVKVENMSDVLAGAFENGLFEVCNELCKKVAADGEGATKRVEVNVRGAKTEHDAKLVAKAVANSNLTKCALFGNDPNWGRIACAVGYSGARFWREKMTIDICGIRVFGNMQPVDFDRKKASMLLKKKVVNIDIDLGGGDKEATAHTCDLSYDYVRINADYHT